MRRPCSSPFLCVVAVRKKRLFPEVDGCYTPGKAKCDSQPQSKWKSSCEMMFRNEGKPMRSILQEVLFEFFSAIYVVLVVVFLWRHPGFIAIALTLGLLIQVRFWKTRADVVVIAAAAVLGLIGEIACVHFNLWKYHAPGLVFGVPAWLSLVWAYNFCLFRRMSMTTFSMIENGGKAVRIIMRLAGFGILIYTVITLILIIRPVAAVFLAVSIPAVIFWRTDRDILIFIVSAIFGTAGEYLCMKLGFWHYTMPYLRGIGVPLSLPLAWGLSGVILGRAARPFEKRGESGIPASIDEETEKLGIVENVE